VKVAIFSDVHGNLPALQAFVNATRDRAEEYLCLGDVVNYGPWNNECLEAVAALPGIRLLEGNHERLFSGATPIDSQPSLIREFYEYSSCGFSRLDLITDLPRECELGSYLCLHTIGNARIFRDSAVELGRSMIIGHSHQQFVVERDGHKLVNPGSVGQNRSNLILAQYALYDTESAAIELCSAEYPYQELLREIKARGYSQRLIEYYRSKIPSNYGCDAQSATPRA
jgi:predicted phosphodiesterase